MEHQAAFARLTAAVAAVAAFGALLVANWVSAAATGPGDEVQNAHFRSSVLNNLVHVRSDGQAGFGLIIGRRDGKLWIATAAHVVFHPPWDRFKAFKRIEVRQQDSLAFQAIVDGPTTGNARVDLALIAVPARPLELFFTAIAAPPPTKGQEVWLGGVTGRFEYHSKVGKFEGLDPGSGVYRVKEMHGLPASSGGIAVTRAGVIGLYIVDSGDSSVVPMEAVQKAAFDRNVPFDLVDSGIRIGGELDLCVVNDGPENVKLHLIADKRYALDSQGCVHGPVQPYRVFADDLNVVCSLQM